VLRFRTSSGFDLRLTGRSAVFSRTVSGGEQRNFWKPIDMPVLPQITRSFFHCKNKKKKN